MLEKKIGNQAMQIHTPTSTIDQDDSLNSSNNTNTNTKTVTHQHIPVNTYVSALINPPPHANPKLAAREGIKACQFALTGIKESAISHLNNLQLKDLLRNTITELGMSAGKIRLVINICDKGIIMEADTDLVAIWLAQSENQKKICNKIDPSIKFKARSFMVIALNVPTDMDPKNSSHLAKICKANNLMIDTNHLCQLG